MSQRITLQHINKEIVRPLPPPPDLIGKKIKGEDLFPDVYSNIGIIARKKSGKTLSIFKILKKTMGKDTQLICFVSTIYKDNTWKHITKYFQNKGNNVIKYTSLMEKGENKLEELVRHLEEEAEEEEEEENDEVINIPAPKNLINFDSVDDESKPKRKSKYVAPEYIIVLDDLSSELKNKALIELLKKNRHFKCKVILSTQYIHDMAPEELKQLDYWLIFKGQPYEKLVKIHKDADLALPLDMFVMIYKKATENKYSFLYIDVQNELYRRNFNTLFNIPDNLLY